MMLTPGRCLAFRLTPGVDAEPSSSRIFYGAACVLRGWPEDDGRAIVAITRLHSDHPPRPEEVAAAEVLIMSYDGLLFPTAEIYVLRAAALQRARTEYLDTGLLQVTRTHDLRRYVQAGDGWDGIPDTVERQFAWERDGSPPPSERLHLAKLL